MTIKKGFFITIEGPDGCGKTTQAKRLVQLLRQQGLQVVHTREPGGTSFAENLRSILLNPRFKILPLSELLLYEASRAQHTDEVIRPALSLGKIVICERYTDATCAYQGYGRKLNLTTILKLNRIATGDLKPDLTILLDISVKKGLRRARRATGKESQNGDRLEQENSSFHNRVRNGYFVLAKKEPKRIKIVSAEGTIEKVQDKICEIVRDKIKKNEFFKNCWTN